MSALVSFTENGVPFIVCQYARGELTHRRAIACTVQGTALLGPATFPSLRPETFLDERAVYRRGRWWIVARRAKRATGVVRG